MVLARSPPEQRNTQVAGKSPQGVLLKPVGLFSRAFRRAICRNKHAEQDIPYWQKRAEYGSSDLPAQGAKQTQVLAIEALKKTEVILKSKLILVQLRQSVVVSPTQYSQSYCMLQTAVKCFNDSQLLETCLSTWPTGKVKSKSTNTHWRKISQIKNLKFITVLLFEYFIWSILKQLFYFQIPLFLKA